MSVFGQVGEVAAALMDKVEAYGGEVREVLVLAEVTDDDGETSFIDWHSSTPDPFKQAGLLRVAEQAASAGFERDVPNGEDS